jgi:hypothetical protein
MASIHLHLCTYLQYDRCQFVLCLSLYIIRRIIQSTRTECIPYKSRSVICYYWLFIIDYWLWPFVTVFLSLSTSCSKCESVVSIIIDYWLLLPAVFLLHFLFCFVTSYFRHLFLIFLSYHPHILSLSLPFTVTLSNSTLWSRVPPRTRFSRVRICECSDARDRTRPCCHGGSDVTQKNIIISGNDHYFVVCVCFIC